MKSTFFSIILLFLFYSDSFCQDYILKLKEEIKTIDVGELSINNTVVRVKSIARDSALNIPLEDVVNINFHEDTPDELNILTFKLDTIKCHIDSISPRVVYFRTENNLLQSVNKTEIFTIQFNRFTHDAVFDRYKDAFINFHRSSYLNSNIFIKNDNSKIEFLKLHSLNNDTLIFSILHEDKEVRTYITKAQIKSLICKEPSEKRKFISTQTFLVSNQGSIKEVDINKISDDRVSVSINLHDEYHNLDQYKEAIKGLFFYNILDLNTTSAAGSTQVGNYFQEEIFEPTVRVFFDVRTGFGYLMKAPPSTLTSAEKAYYNQLRSGFTVDANFNLVFNGGIGLGIKYNYFYTYSSSEKIGSDNINVNFIGGTLLGQTKLTNRTFFNTSLSIGYLNERDNFNIEGVGDGLMKGSTLGAYFSMGMDFLLAQNVFVNISAGGIAGKIKRVNINGYIQDIDKGMSEARIDGMIGLKFLF